MKKKPISMLIKTIVDISFSILILLILFPVMVIISIAVSLESTGPFIFKQQRVGKNGKLFYVYKFRTMVSNAEAIGLGYNIEENDKRITGLGKFLRTWSLDELPQLINVVKGEMSMIGPRPTLPYQVSSYTPTQYKRLQVKPGITGLAQVSGRNSIPWEKRIELDLWYIDHWSLYLDIVILLKTIKIIAKRESIYNKNGMGYDFTPENRNTSSK